MNQRDLFRKKIEEKKEKASKKPRYGMRKLSVGFVSCLVGFVMFLTGVPVMAEGGQSRSVNNEVHYTLAGETDGVLDYARTDYTKEDSDGIHLTVTKWAKLPGTWGYTERGPYNGRYLLNFFEDDFYTQIESIKVNNTEFEKEANGALWKVPIENATLHSGGIGAITNDDIVIKLKSGASLTSLGLADKKINFTTTWVRNDAKADTGGYDNGYILKNNTNVPTLPSNPSNGNEYYLGTGLNGLTNDGTKSKDGNFTSGNTGKVVSYDAKEKAIRSTVSFKPDQNFLQANSGWVLYINEVIPKELLKYIDTNNVRLGVSTSRGKITANEPIKLTVDPNGNGHISTKDTPELSIEGGDWDRVTKVRSTLDSQVFYGALGQRRSYTIEYKLKSDVSNQEFAKALNEYITTNNSQLNFESWLTADFVDSTNAFPGIRKPDGGKPNKILQNSYANAFMEVLDTDKDGLYDFLEDEIDSDKFKVDTDGDGVPDGQEVLADKTDPKNAKSYLVVKPDVTTKTIEANSTQTIVGKVPKTIYDNPADTSKKLAATNPDAGNVIVKAYKYVADNTDYTTQPVKAQTTIPFADLTDGNFTVNVPAGTFAEGDKVILVAYSPDGNNPKVSSTTVRVGAIKVTFDTNGGKWSDGTNADKIVNAVNGAATQPEEPTRDGYQFLGWASTDNATVAEAGILDNVSEDKEVFAVWKDNKAPVIGNIGDQTVVERNAITEINVTTDDPTATVTVKDLPSGLTYSNGKISGTPSVTSWGNDEKKEFTVTVEAKDPSGNTSTKTFKIIVHRDTDRDGTPDITDTDDDGDGVPDTVEIAKGSDPKNPNSRPMGTVTPVSPTTISNPTQTVIDENAITNIVITPGNTASTVTVDTSKLPNGVTYDPITKTISGTPDVTNWGTDETKKFDIPVVITNPDGSKVTKTVEITVQRDTDSDGTPDVTDTDDDGDGVTDTEEIAKGSDPKNPNSRPMGTVTPVSPTTISNPTQTLIDENAITNIVITPGNTASTVTVDTSKLPNGVTYDPITKTISGTPDVTNWGTDETKKFDIPVVITNPDGSKVTKTVEITVQRDTDGDGTPDVTDTDDDGDGVSDTEEIAKGSDPKNPNSRPMGTVTPVSPTTISNPTQTVIDENAITNIVITPGNTASTVTVDTSKLPNGVTYDPTTKTISGTPDVTNWGTDETKKFDIPVVITNPDGSKVTKTVEITVQRDTDGDGIPDITDTDDDGDGYTDLEESAKGTDPKDATSKPTTGISPIADQTVVEGNAISEITVTTDNPTATVTVKDLPAGVTYDPSTKKISGTPSVTGWGSDETKDFTVTIEAKDSANNVVTKTFKITVQRDTDSDGTPDVTDTDDDGDGVSDTEEIAKGSDPKNPNSRPMGTVTPVSPTTISNPTQTVIDENAITNIVITPGNTAYTVTVDTSKLPNGVTYDPTTKTISGTPDVTNWGTDETKKFDIPVVITNPDGSKITKTVEITVQRDTDGDGIPDITDTDDDGDGYTDLEENAKGTDPKDPTSKPTTGISPIANQTVVEGNAISEITVTTDNPTATVTVKDLPAGVTYDPSTKKISGTPSVTGWGSDETKDFTVTIEAKDSANNVVTRTFKITVQRDTDSDGTPDVTDTDDDGDGVTDTEEIAKGSDPKNPNSRPMGTVTPVSPTTISNPTQTLIDENAITNIVITPGNTASTVTVDTSKLPNGVTYDPTTKTISGTPDVTNWGTDETKKFDIPVVITNPDGSKVTKTVEITVQRDTDSDGTPDVTDTDDDGDGVPDTEEIAKGSDPKNPNSRPMGTVTPVSPTTISNPTQTLIDENAITNIVITPGNTASTVTVDTSKLPNGVTYDPTTKTISGTPDVTNWGTDETKKFDIPVVITNPDGSKVTKTVEITVQRDTDGDGTPDVTDTDDDGDGYTDVEENAKGTDPKDPTSVPTTPGSTTITNPTQTVIDEKPITSIVITPGNPSTTITVDTSKLPNGVTYDPTTKTISGTPDVTDWGPSEETRKFEVPVVVQNPDGTTENKKIEITIQRDTDNDGIPDVTDTDDDGDGVTDTEEIAKGSDPKNPNSRPMGTVAPVSPTNVTNPNQTVIDEKPITSIVITPGNTASTVTVDTSKLPNGVTYDPTTKTISGTPDVTNWGPSEETRKFEVPVVVTNPDGSKTTKTVEIVVQRDTDKDGNPDVTDPDDDNDGVTDVEENAKGTNPKDPNSKPTNTSTQTNNQGSGKKIDTGRIAGKDRIDTAIDISKKLYKKSKAVIIVRSDIFPDSMTASVLARLKDAPILLNPTGQLDSRVAAEIKRLGATEIIIVGGADSISARVRDELRAYDSDNDVERIGGKDRYETSELVARKVISITGNKNTAVVASGQVFPDALTVGTFASRDGYPILLVKKDIVPSQIERVIKDLDIDKVYIAGGTDTISKRVEAKLPRVIERMAGRDRYETSVAIARSKFKDSKEAFVASGQQFADALVISPVSGKYNLPTLLVSTNASSNQEVKRYIQQSKINKLIAVGGERYLPSSIIDNLIK